MLGVSGHGAPCGVLPQHKSTISKQLLSPVKGYSNINIQRMDLAQATSRWQAAAPRTRDGDRNGNNVQPAQGQGKVAYSAMKGLKGCPH